ncbi:MAG: phosphoribosylformylglycinamidine synthase subunit PurQ, partial [Lachnospiraceae bacterium]|nr:phosphoribosylformylglycinamidine synthase subunit PurQ [Lachnospiraceae bacterium]
GKTDTVTMMSYGFDPYLSSWSPYHGAVYAVTDSIAKIVAAGGDYRDLHFTFQEYFGRMSSEPSRWSQPFSALLGAYDAQIGYGIASIGGKDSMSGTFNDIDVPPTLVSFAVDTAKIGDVVTPELKKAGDKLYCIRIEKDEYDMPVYDDVMAAYRAVTEMMRDGAICAAYAVDAYGIMPAACKMAFGNKLGIRFNDQRRLRSFFKNGIGNLIVEMGDGAEALLDEMDLDYVLVGEVTEDPVFSYGSALVPVDRAIAAWKKPLEKVFPSIAVKDKTPVETPIFKADSIAVCTHKLAQPTVFIPVFPGTNCEYDSAKAFEAAGAKTITRVFTNLTAEGIRESVTEFAKAIDQSQIIMFPGGFSAGDEPDGSAKFFATAFRNGPIEEAVMSMLNERDGLILGICNGFQALIKLGLVPNGSFTGQNEESPTLTYNTIGRHISKMAYTKVVSNKSPWLAGAELGGVYVNPASHGEGRFVAPKAWIDKLFANGQVATQYSDPDGNISMDEEWNINGSFCSIEGITSPDGRIFGKMVHCERRGYGVNLNIVGDQDMKLFESGVCYFS